MSFQARLTVALLFCSALVAPAFGGPNEGGTLILHGVEEYRGRPPWEPWCGWPVLENCEDATVEAPGGSSNGWVWFVYAAFPEGSSSSLMGVTFGIDYDDSTVFLVDYEPCASFELADNTWPAPGSGTAVTWTSPQTDPLVQVYAFAGYEYYDRRTQFCLTPHPTQGGYFADDSIPAVLDPITGFGCLGFGGDSGNLPCPAPIGSGACCLPDGSCEMNLEEQCSSAGGTWFGPEVTCDMNPCPVPTESKSWGTVKTRFR